MNNRVRILSEGVSSKKSPPGPVVFWMNRDQRAEDHWGLLYARQQARQLNAHLVVIFFLVPEYLQASQDHYQFMIEGLQETAATLEEKGIPFHLIRESPVIRLPQLINEWQVPLLVTDFNPLTIKKKWEQVVLTTTICAFHQVDSHNIVPCWEASSKLEYAAYTFRPKIHRKLTQYMTDYPELESQSTSQTWQSSHSWMMGQNDGNISNCLYPASGPRAAKEKLQFFLNEKLHRYGNERNDPFKNAVSGLSPYLHFGQVSAQRIAVEVMKESVPSKHRDDFLEELIVRRELSDNFCFYQPEYDKTAAFHPWAQRTLADHQQDQRDYLYTRSELEGAQTHDILWNAALQQMKLTGSLHGYLRMYWAKKILEWTPDAATALADAIYLNDKYFLDGRDPNGYAGIAWSIGGVHDRAWAERKVFGKIRYMNEKGCRRKFNVDVYIQQVAEMMTHHRNTHS
ncbi:MAG: deoxyribodipyrimidine photo-lyase [Bacillota bacterium]|nr:deoxyribodipyrimidine photo-lyase [Bacillota bacterium]MDW7676982.1 deoxyribodipyrimidine photo-lyase [Bacillota bacterium]